MTDLRTRIANAHLNLPELKVPTAPNNAARKNEIVLIEGKTNSVVEKLNKHRKIGPTNDSAQQDDAFKWLKIKEKMMIDMENKRDEEWKQQTLNDKLENEELDELFEGDDFDDDDAASDVKDDAELNTQNNGEDNDDEDNEDDNDIRNDFFDDQAEEDEKQDDSDDEELFASSKSKPKKIIEDDDEDEEDIGDKETSNAIKSDHENGDDEVESSEHDQIDNADEFSKNDNDFPFSYFDSQNSDKYCISQNLPLTPLDADMNKRSTNALPFDMDANSNFDENFDSQMLANMCSGQFALSSALIGEDNSNLNLIEDQHDSDDESEDNNVGDDEQPADEDDQSDVEQYEKIKPKKSRINDFIEDEAELSGSEDDVSSDENDDDDEAELEQDEIDEDLPSEDELRGQLGKIFNKDILDEDKRQLMIMKEYYFDDGDLHDEDDDRKKKFKWKLSGEDMDDFVNVLSDSEEDDTQSNASDDDESQNNKVIRLKKDSSTIEQIETINTEGDEFASISTSESVVKSSKFQTAIRKTKISACSTKISSFFIKDERLKGILNKRPANFPENCFNKKQKTQDSKSIFDVINC